MIVAIVMTVLTVGIFMMALWSSRTQSSRQDELDEMYRLEMECSHIRRMKKLQEDLKK
tara:strand:+ start:454 stop:627 length:174 start_codon:yes stop_codon:yes gene_type:complete